VSAAAAPVATATSAAKAAPAGEAVIVALAIAIPVDIAATVAAPSAHVRTRSVVREGAQGATGIACCISLTSSHSLAPRPAIGAVADRWSWRIAIAAWPHPFLQGRFAIPGRVVAGVAVACSLPGSPTFSFTSRAAVPVRLPQEADLLEGTTATGRWWWFPAPHEYMCGAVLPVDTVAADRDSASRAHQKGAGCCVAWHDSDGLTGSINCPAGITVHAGGLTSVCLVLDTAAAEVIPTNDLPPSTTPSHEVVVRCGSR
jgi:hypothetical protein